MLAFTLHTQTLHLKVSTSAAGENYKEDFSEELSILPQATLLK